MILDSGHPQVIVEASTISRGGSRQTGVAPSIGCRMRCTDHSRRWHTHPVGFREWLYGPIYFRGTDGFDPGQVVIAPLTLDTDAMREFYIELSKQRQVRIHASSGYSGSEPTVDDVDGLLKLPLFDRRNIVFTSSDYESNRTGFSVYFSTFTYGRVSYPEGSTEEAAIVHQAFLALDAMAKRRPRMSRIRDVARCLSVLLLAALFAWSCAAVADARNWPAFVLIGLALVPVVHLIDGWLRRRFQHITQRTHVTRYLEMSRSQQQQERWNKKLNFKWSLGTAAVTVPLSVLLTFALTR